MNEKLPLKGAVLVEGKYDAARLANLVEGLILLTDGFDIYSNKEKQKMLRNIAKKDGITILTDSDGAGFKIRHYVTNLVGEQYVRQAFIPALEGKESRKKEPGKEGLLGVEGVEDAIILNALREAGAFENATVRDEPSQESLICYYDLCEWGLSGGEGCAEFRRAFLKFIGLPPRISKKSLLQVLNRLYTKSAVEEMLHSFHQK